MSLTESGVRQEDELRILRKLVDLYYARGVGVVGQQEPRFSYSMERLAGCLGEASENVEALLRPMLLRAGRI